MADGDAQPGRGRRIHGSSAPAGRVSSRRGSFSAGPSAQTSQSWQATVEAQLPGTAGRWRRRRGLGRRRLGRHCRREGGFSEVHLFGRSRSGGWDRRRCEGNRSSGLRQHGRRSGLRYELRRESGGGSRSGGGGGGGVVDLDVSTSKRVRSGVHLRRLRRPCERGATYRAGRELLPHYTAHTAARSERNVHVMNSPALKY